MKLIFDDDGFEALWKMKWWMIVIVCIWFIIDDIIIDW